MTHRGLDRTGRRLSAECGAAPPLPHDESREASPGSSGAARRIKRRPLRCHPEPRKARVKDPGGQAVKRDTPGVTALHPPQCCTPLNRGRPPCELPLCLRLRPPFPSPAPSKNTNIPTALIHQRDLPKMCKILPAFATNLQQKCRAFQRFFNLHSSPASAMMVSS